MGKNANPARTSRTRTQVLPRPEPEPESKNVQELEPSRTRTLRLQNSNRTRTQFLKVLRTRAVWFCPISKYEYSVRGIVDQTLVTLGVFCASALSMYCFSSLEIVLCVLGDSDEKNHHATNHAIPNIPAHDVYRRPVTATATSSNTSYGFSAWRRDVWIFILQRQSSARIARPPRR